MTTREKIVKTLDDRLPGHSTPSLPSSGELADAILRALGLDKD